VIRGVRGRHALLRAEPGASVRAARVGAGYGHRFSVHTPSVPLGPRRPHR
jgi:hypothetical protein